MPDGKLRGRASSLDTLLFAAAFNHTHLRATYPRRTPKGNERRETYPPATCNIAGHSEKAIDSMREIWVVDGRDPRASGLFHHPGGGVRTSCSSKLQQHTP
jgi:hypothetical protein